MTSKELSPGDLTDQWEAGLRGGKHNSVGSDRVIFLWTVKAFRKRMTWDRSRRLYPGAGGLWSESKHAWPQNRKQVKLIPSLHHSFCLNHSWHLCAIINIQNKDKNLVVANDDSATHMHCFIFYFINKKLFLNVL